MSRRRDEPEPVPAAESFGKLTIDHLKPLVRLLTSDVPARKPELVAVLVRYLTNPTEVRSLYENLDPLAQQFVQEAVHDPEGVVHQDRFIARHGQMPGFYKPAPEEKLSYRSYDTYKRPTSLCLFFPQFGWLPSD